MKTLVVDDSRAARMLIRSILTEYDCSLELFEAGNGQEAVEAYRLHQPEITFLDLTMPVMNGFEALKIILKEFPSAIVIILTADIQEKSVQKCMDSGAYMVMKKLPQKTAVFEVLDKVKSEIGASDG